MIANPSAEVDLTIKNNLKNKLDQSDKAFHRWYRFVLSFPPHLVRRYIHEFKLSKDDLILDPFCGTGTTLVEAKIQNINSIGIEANPFAHFATSVKCDWNISGTELLELAKKIYNSVTMQILSNGITDEPSKQNVKVPQLAQLTPEQDKLLLKNSISPLPLHKCLKLIEEINKYNKTPYYKYLSLAVANAAVHQFSNLKFGPEVGVGKIKDDFPVISCWLDQIEKIVTDLEQSLSITTTAQAEVFLNDSRNVIDYLNGRKVSAVITSPPYPNEKDYTRTTRLESVLLGFINDKSDLRKFKKTLLRSNTRGVYIGDADDHYVKDFLEIQRIAEEIESQRIRLGKTSGFEKLYHKVAKLYFGGIAKHLMELQPILKPNAHLAYVVGDQASYLRVMIRTGNLIAGIARSLGYELVRSDLFRTRFSTATKTDLNEEVVILRWPGKK
ncbi:MAG: DNA methyltransferase [Chitinophagaceae bacterium]|nr:DNA methyltransferase [Chitinophagaceae bacterium]